jgi:hypothetical protein
MTRPRFWLLLSIALLTAGMTPLLVVSSPGREQLKPVVLAADSSTPPSLYQVPQLEPVYFTSAQLVEVDNLDPRKVYIAQAGSHVRFKRAISDPDSTPIVRVIAQSGSKVEAIGTQVSVTAADGSYVEVSDGVRLDATGAVVYVRGDAFVKAFAKAEVHNQGSGETHAFEGSVIYTQGKGRTFAEKGSLVYARSPENCDACTQVQAAPGSTVHVYKGAEVFGKGATVYAYSGGEVICSRHCTVYLYPDSERNLSPNCIVHEMPDESDAIPFKP